MATTPDEAPPIPRLARLRVLGPAIGAHHVLALLGTIFFATMLAKHPAGLLALSSRNRHLLLTVPAGITAFAFFAIAFVRLAYPAAPYYALGAYHGDRGLAWFEREAGGLPPTVRWIERAFDKARHVVVLIFPGNTAVSLLAGHRRMGVRVFTTLVVVGIVLRLVAFWVLAQTFEEPLTKLVSFITRYQWWIVIAFVVLTVIQSGQQGRKAVRMAGGPAVDLDDLGEAADEEREAAVAGGSHDTAGIASAPTGDGPSTPSAVPSRTAPPEAPRDDVG